MTSKKELITDSDDYSTDDMRKRRRSEIRDEIFDKSRKTQRSPNKTQSDDGKLDLLVKMVKGLTEDVKLVRIQQEQYNVEMLKIQEENAKLRKENDNIKKENQEIKKELTEITRNLEVIDKENRKNNIVIQGMKIRTNETGTIIPQVEKFIKDYLEVEAKNQSNLDVNKDISKVLVVMIDPIVRLLQTQIALCSSTPLKEKNVFLKKQKLEKNLDEKKKS
ncbi:hypothetical protein RN001_005182 [Aquatica leii]|uniref:Uncharacterized protein n=1 Tax=Aquatica leii TaxID=1421715 RepID=A0AAN7SPS5_9COLE|nr:hypothetical protein RN001_005182 [Aquatica leii]